MNIEELLNKYFEGETSCDEEKTLRGLFACNEVPEHLQMYRPMFAYFDEEAERDKAIAPASAKRIPVYRRTAIYALGGIAAGLLLILGVAGIYRQLNGHHGNYMLIDGKRYTDTELIQQEAEAAFTNVSFSREEVFAALFDEE